MIWIFFFLHHFCSCIHCPSFLFIRTVFQYSRMGLLPLAVFNTERACFLIIFSSLRWHWFMRVMSDTHPPRPLPLPSTRLAVSPASLFFPQTMFPAFFRSQCFSPHTCDQLMVTSCYRSPSDRLRQETANFITHQAQGVDVLPSSSSWIKITSDIKL